MGEGGGQGGQSTGRGWNVRGVVAQSRGSPWGYREAAVLGLGGCLSWPGARDICWRTHGCNTNQITWVEHRSQQESDDLGQSIDHNKNLTTWVRALTITGIWQRGSEHRSYKESDDLGQSPLYTSRAFC